MTDALFRGLLTLPETRCLAVGIHMPWENNLPLQFAFWQAAQKSGLITQLRERCGGNIVGLFCHDCDMEARTFSYHIACENRRFSPPGSFEALILKPLTYARFEGVCASPSDRFAAYERLCEAFWGQWLPGSGYISLIEPDTCACHPGYAAIERFEPEVPLSAYRLTMLFPVEKQPC